MPETRYSSPVKLLDDADDQETAADICVLRSQDVQGKSAVTYVKLTGCAVHD